MKMIIAWANYIKIGNIFSVINSFNVLVTTLDKNTGEFKIIPRIGTSKNSINYKFLND